jgi:hypothetical protein
MIDRHNDFFISLRISSIVNIVAEPLVSVAKTRRSRFRVNCFLDLFERNHSCWLALHQLTCILRIVCLSLFFTFVCRVWNWPILFFLGCSVPFSVISIAIHDIAQPSSDILGTTVLTNTQIRLSRCPENGHSEINNESSGT